MSKRHLVRSGDIGVSNGALGALGYYGVGWAGVTKSYSSIISATAYSLYFYDFTDKSGVSTSNTAHRWGGYPVRCLVY